MLWSQILLFVCSNDSDTNRQVLGFVMTFSLFLNRKSQQTRTCSEASVTIGLFGIQSKGSSHSCWWMLQWTAWYGLQRYSIHCYSVKRRSNNYKNNYNNYCCNYEFQVAFIINVFHLKFFLFHSSVGSLWSYDSCFMEKYATLK